MKEKFWFVWNPDGYAPTYRHPSLLAACTEAERLALKAPGQTFVVLESVAEVQRSDVSWTEHYVGQKAHDVDTADDLPF